MTLIDDDDNTGVININKKPAVVIPQPKNENSTTPSGVVNQREPIKPQPKGRVNPEISKLAEKYPGLYADNATSFLKVSKSEIPPNYPPVFFDPTKYKRR